MEWSDSVRTIKGIGEKAEQCLSKLGIVSVGDMLEHYPRRYDEWKELYLFHSWKREKFQP